MRGQQYFQADMPKCNFLFQIGGCGPEETPQQLEYAKKGIEKRTEENLFMNDTSKQKCSGW